MIIAIIIVILCVISLVYAQITAKHPVDNPFRYPAFWIVFAIAMYYARGIYPPFPSSASSAGVTLSTEFKGGWIVWHGVIQNNNNFSVDVKHVSRYKGENTRSFVTLKPKSKHSVNFDCFSGFHVYRHEGPQIGFIAEQDIQPIRKGDIK